MLNLWLRRAVTAGMRRGMAGSQGWLVVAIVAGGLRVLVKLAGRDAEVLYRTVVQPGDQFEIVSAAPRKRKK